MEEKHIAFSKDGLKVGVREVSDEDYAAAQQKCVLPICFVVDHSADNQSYLVKAWNASSFPAYRSKLWNREETLRQQKLAEDAKRMHMKSGLGAGSSGSATGSAASKPWSKAQ